MDDLSTLGSMLADRNRATMLLELLDGRALPASELATRAGVSKQLASAHLAKLRVAGLVVVEEDGRFRRYRLASRELAAALEALSAMTRPAAPRGLREHVAFDALRYARSCYDHLAGVLGVELAERMQADGLLEPVDGGFAVTGSGASRLEAFGVDVAELARRRRAFCRRCLDWTERRDHVAGSVGAALLAGFLERGWLRRLAGTRALAVTPHGAEAFREEWRVEVPPERRRRT